MQTTLTSSDHLASLIMVEAPYNRLEDLELHADGSLTASVANEYLGPREAGPMGVAEVGRHIAILGSILLAEVYNFGEKCYYLATSAHLQRQSSRVYGSERFSLKVSQLERSKRQGRVEGSVCDDQGGCVFKLTVTYQVVRKNVFAKLYRDHWCEAREHAPVSPYLQRRPLTNLQVSESCVRADYGVIDAGDCEGHFAHYPALPVAIVGNLFIELGMRLADAAAATAATAVAPDEKWMAMDTQIEALRLAFAGEAISFETSVKQWETPDKVQIIGRALVEDEVVSTITFTLQKEALVS